MATAAKSEEQAAAPVNGAVLFELENTAVSGRKIVYGMMEKILGDRGVDFDQVAFSRYCLNAPLKQAVLSIAAQGGGSASSADRLVDALASEMSRAFAEDAPEILPGMKALLDAAASQGLALGALSCLPEDQAQALAGQVGLIDAGGEILAMSDDSRLAPTADAWLKLAKQVDVSASQAVVLTTSSASCKAALSAGMRCVVVPDQFTAFQDFGGARTVVDELNSAAIEEIVAILKA